MPRANIFVRERNKNKWQKLHGQYSDFINWCLENKLEEYIKSKKPEPTVDSKADWGS